MLLYLYYIYHHGDIIFQQLAIDDNSCNDHNFHLFLINVKYCVIEKNIEYCSVVTSIVTYKEHV